MVIRGFERAQDAPSEIPNLDKSQARVIALDDSACASVIGAPGSGKTLTAVELVADRVVNRGWSPDELVVLTPSRAGASALRDRLARRLDRPSNGPLARTVNSLAFEIVTEAARHAGVPVPRLATGGDQDADISQLLRGHADDGSGPQWPEPLTADVRALRGFRTELRELMARATEYGIAPDALRELGRSSGHPEWVAAADFISEYLTVVATSREHQLDPSELAQFAVAALDSYAGERVSRLRLVIVDDLQEATESTLALLRALGKRGIAIIAFGDPDVAANAFRGGEPDALGRLASVLELESVHSIVLSSVHRQSPALREFTSRITQRIGTAAAGSQRAAIALAQEADVPPILTVEAPTPARVWASTARLLREHHLLRGVPWSRMAVVLRSGAAVAPAARALALAEVPTRTSVGGRPLRDDHAARALLTVVDVGTGRSPLSAELANDILLGPFGGIDRLGQADRVAGLLAALRESAERGATIEELLWLAWDASGLASTWFDRALATGIVADEANRHLDGVVALFTAAKRFVEREPASPALAFLSNVLDAEVPEDTLSPQPTSDTVFVTTPPGVVGLEYDVVVIAGVQDGAWPNLRLRGSLLNSQELVRVVTKVDSSTLNERSAVLGDELRMFALAASRATAQVIVSAVVNDDEAGSVFFSLIPATATRADVSSQAPLSLRGITGRLRRELTAPGRAARERDAAASALARLVAEKVPGADPRDWHGLVEPSTSEPLFGDSDPIPVSPSQLARVEDSPVDWFIESISGSEPSTAMAVGTIVHWAMEHATDPSIDTVWAMIESRWPELSFEAPWMAEFQKRATRVLAAGVAEYLSDFERDGRALVAAERRFTLEIDRARVNGSIDRVERAPDGAVVIVDLKTGAALTKQIEIDAHPQLGAYQLAYAEGVLDEFLEPFGEHRGGGAKLLFVKKGVRGKAYREAVQAVLTHEQLEGFRTRIRQAAALMAAAEFRGEIAIDVRAPGAGARLLHRVKAVPSD